jgi:hypothetical protein
VNGVAAGGAGFEAAACLHWIDFAPADSVAARYSAWEGFVWVDFAWADFVYMAQLDATAD